MGLNVAVYVLWQLALRQPGDAAIGFMSANFLVSAEGVRSGMIWTLLTSAFSHIDPMHLFANMLALWVFGVPVQRVIGSKHFVHLYLVGGLVASLGHVVLSIYMGTPNPALGASGSVMAIAVLYAALYPRRVLMVNFFIPVPAALAVAAYILLDVFGVLGGVGDGIAHGAHLGGAAYGLVYYLFYVRPRLEPVR